MLLLRNCFLGHWAVLMHHEVYCNESGGYTWCRASRIAFSW